MRRQQVVFALRHYSGERDKRVVTVNKQFWQNRFGTTTFHPYQWMARQPNYKFQSGPRNLGSSRFSPLGVGVVGRMGERNFALSGPFCSRRHTPATQAFNLYASDHAPEGMVE